MNVNILEKVARQIIRGEATDSVVSAMLTPAEHRSLKSLSWQIAANVQANGAGATIYANRVKPMGGWL